jgi:tetratricopeptide (TPR) repeat protein
MADYNQAIKFNPNYALPYNNRGIIKRNKNDLAGAIADFNRAITLNPKYANAYRTEVLRSKRKETTTVPSQTSIVL